MNENRIIYSLSVEDILDVMEENNVRINLSEEAITFIQDKVGDIIDWRSAIEFALFEYENKNKREFSDG
ncbi:MAG: hypothetical protein JXA92_09420 [candidate division Zixibacteria bacterium]|nr:hypothetical protein [candidate division Zixibacteria bacterium]